MWTPIIGEKRQVIRQKMTLNREDQSPDPARLLGPPRAAVSRDEGVEPEAGFVPRERCGP
jgi:hypothetical protein